MSTNNSHPAAHAASLRTRREAILSCFNHDLYERQDFSTPAGYPHTLRGTLRVLTEGDLSSEIELDVRAPASTGRRWRFREEFRSLVYGLVYTLQTMLNYLVVATADDMDSPPPAWRFEGTDGSLVNQFSGLHTRTSATIACGHLSMRCHQAICTYRDYQDQAIARLSPWRHSASAGLQGGMEKLSPQGNGITKAEDLHPHLAAPRQAAARGDRMRANAGGKTALILSGKDVNSQDSRDRGKLSPQDAGLDAKSKDLDSRSEAHCQAPAQGDCLCANAGGQTVVLSRNGIKVHHAHSAEEHASQLFAYGAAAKTSGPSSSLGSDSPKGSGSADSAALLPSLAHISPDSPRSSSCEMKAQDLRDIDDQAVQKVEARSSSTSRGHILCPSRDDTEAAAPPAPSLTVRAIRPSGTRAAEAVNSNEYITMDCEQRRVLGFRMSGGVSAVDKEENEGITCGSSADGHDLTNVALPRQFSKKPTSPDTSSHAHAVAKTRARISSHSSRDDEKRSPQGAQPEYNENPAKSPDWDGQDCALHVSADSLSPSPSTALRRQATFEPPDKTNSNDSSLRSGRSTSRPRSAPVPSAAPPFRSSHPSTSESGPDSANWRARGWLKASSRQEVGAVEADSRDKSISKCEKDSPHRSPHRSHWEASSQASAQDRPQVYAGGQVLTSSRQDGKPGSSRGAGKGLPQNAKSDTAVAVPDDSVRAHATVEPYAEINSHSPCDTPERSSPDSYLRASHCRGPDEVLSSPPLLRSSRGSPNRADWRTRGRPAESRQREIDAQDAGERAAVSSREYIDLCGVRYAREHLPRSAGAERNRHENSAQYPDSDGRCRPPRASTDGLSPSPSIAPHYHVAREPPKETTSNGSSLRGSRSISLSHFATVPSAAPLPSSPSSATPLSG